MKLMLLAALVLSGCALFRGEELQCTLRFATAPVTLTGCLDETWDGHSPVQIHPCELADAGAP